MIKKSVRRQRQQREVFNLIKKSKYGNKKIKVGDMTFDSEKEYTRWKSLKWLERLGVIKDLKRQVKFELVEGVRFLKEKRKKPAICYYADFTYTMNNQFIVEDVKSEITRKDGVYRIKKHLMMAKYDIEIEEV